MIKKDKVAKSRNHHRNINTEQGTKWGWDRSSFIWKENIQEYVYFIYTFIHLYVHRGQRKSYFSKHKVEEEEKNIWASEPAD